MAITQNYVDYGAGNDTTGDGTVGTPWKTLQKAFDTCTRSADGNQINLKTGTAHVNAAALDLTTFVGGGALAGSAPLILRGYTSAANDGGIGDIDCNDLTMFSSSAHDYIVLIDLHIHNGGAATLIDLDDYIAVVNCEIDDTTGTGIDIDINGRIVNCYIHNIGTRGVDTLTGAIVRACYFENGTNVFGRAISVAAGSTVEFNVIKLTGASDGIIPAGTNATIVHNTIYSTSGTGEGINNGQYLTNIVNNYIEGFSGGGGDGILSTVVAGTIMGNRYYNNTNSYNVTGNVIDEGDNSELAASGLVDPANGDFRAKITMRAGAWPTTFPSIALPQYLDIGAVQRKEPVRNPRLLVHGR